MKSIVLQRGGKVVFTHSLAKLCQALNINGELENAGKLLDLYYTTTRYPDSLPGGVPADMFVQEQATAAIAKARLFIDKAKSDP